MQMTFERNQTHLLRQRPNELKDRLSAIIPIEMRTRIYVRVIDVSWCFK